MVMTNSDIVVLSWQFDFQGAAKFLLLQRRLLVSHTRFVLLTQFTGAVLHLF